MFYKSHWLSIIFSRLVAGVCVCCLFHADVVAVQQRWCLFAGVRNPCSLETPMFLHGILSGTLNRDEIKLSPAAPLMLRTSDDNAAVI